MGFYVARMARILPVYYLALGAMAVWSFHDHSLDGLDFGLSLALVQAWLPPHSQALNAPGWSLSVEALFYLCFPPLLSLLCRLRSTKALVALLLCAWAGNLALHAALVRLCLTSGSARLHDFVFYHPLTHLATFVGGVAGGLVFDRHHRALARVSGPLMWGSLALFCGMVLARSPVLAFHHNGLFMPLFIAFIWGLGADPRGTVARIFSLPSLVLLGEASYGIYILQAPVSVLARGVEKWGGATLTPGQFFFSYYVLLIAVSVACFRLVETPLRERIKARYAALSGAEAVPGRFNAPAATARAGWSRRDREPGRR